MSSSSTSPTSPRDDDDCQQLSEAVDQSPFFKMAEEFKPQMVQMVPTTAYSKMSEDSQDSSQGQGSSHSRCLIKSCYNTESVQNVARNVINSAK